MLQLGQALWLWRRHRGITQAELARRAGIARPNLSAIEQGKRAVTLGTLRALAAGLDIRPGVLADGVPPGDKQRAPLSRDALERIAEAVVRGGPVRHAEERKLVDALRQIAEPRLLAEPQDQTRLRSAPREPRPPGNRLETPRLGSRRQTRRPGSRREANAAWLWLETAYPSAVIQSLLQRIADRQRQP